MYRSHRSVVQWEAGEEQPIWERCLTGKETKSEEDKGVIKCKQGRRSKVSQVCENRCWLLQFVVGSQWRSTGRDWITSQQQAGTDTPACVSECEKFSTRDLSAFPQGTSLPTPVSWKLLNITSSWVFLVAIHQLNNWQLTAGCSLPL